MLPLFEIVTRKVKGDQILHFWWVECAPSCAWVGEGKRGNRQILNVVRVVYSGLFMVGESRKVLKLSLIRFNC